MELKKEFARRNEAARKLQYAFRAKQARNAIKKMVRENYVKIYDRLNNRYVYKNRNTKEVSHVKPIFLGKDDLPNPRHFNAPFDYDPNDDYDVDGYALVVTVNKFSNGKLPEVPEATDADHFLLENLLTHDYICKFRQENVIFLKNPSCFEFQETMNRFRRLCKGKGYFVAYFCTHVVTVHGGDPDHRHETGYLCMRDTLWTRPQIIAKSSISLNSLVSSLNKIECKQKTVFLNYAHVPDSFRSPFGSKFMYPPPDFAIRLANEATCAVICNCTTGTHVSDLINHTAASTLIASKREEKLKMKKSSKATKESWRQVEGEGDGNGMAVVASSSARPPADASSVMAAPSTKITRFMLPAVSPTVEPAGPTKSCSFEDMFGQYVIDWRVELQDENVYVTPEPDLPDASWHRDENMDMMIKVDIPTEKDFASYRYRLRLWQLKRLFSRPVNAIKRQMRISKKKKLCAPCQSSTVVDNKTSHDIPFNTLFVAALVDCFQGGASTPDNPFVSAEDLFVDLKKRMEALLDKTAAAKLAAKKVADAEEKVANAAQGEKGAAVEDDEDDRAADAAALALYRGPNQTPVLVVPRKQPGVLANPVCCRCGPPCAPERPYIIRVDRNEVKLEWYNPHFDGVPASKYQVFMYNLSRNFKKWTPVYYPGDITANSFLVRNLPMGVPCQFRVAGYNNGGWGAPSLETIMVTPGEEFQPISTLLRWRKLTIGGALGVLDRLAEYPEHRQEHIFGLHKLIVFAQNDKGFSKGAMSTKSTLECLHALHTFPNDVDIAGPAFLLIAWCLRGKGSKKVAKVLELHDITTICEHYVKAFRSDSGVIGGIGMLRSSLKGVLEIPAPAPIIDDTAKKKKKRHGQDDDDSSSSEDEQPAVAVAAGQNKK